ncbi:hypothetical protein DIE01_29405 [Burkholderia sp. Bp8990]|nr:hypothetical protein DIE01_29405 [Burkholderia sp. Bp8990]
MQFHLQGRALFNFNRDNSYYHCHASPTAPANACLRPPRLGEEVLRRTRKTSQEVIDFIDYYFGVGALSLVAARWAYTGKEGWPGKANNPPHLELSC